VNAFVAQRSGQLVACDFQQEEALRVTVKPRQRACQLLSSAEVNEAFVLQTLRGVVGLGEPGAMLHKVIDGVVARHTQCYQAFRATHSVR